MFRLYPCFYSGSSEFENSRRIGRACSTTVLADQIGGKRMSSAAPDWIQKDSWGG